MKMTEQERKFLVKMLKDEIRELEEAENLTEEVDALIDIIYYIVHQTVKKGVNLDPLFDIVHQANMKKIVDGKVLKREDGKILKPKNWQSPEPLLARELKKQNNF